MFHGFLVIGVQGIDCCNESLLGGGFGIRLAGVCVRLTGLKVLISISSGYNGTSGSRIGLIIASDVVVLAGSFPLRAVVEVGISCE